MGSLDFSLSWDRTKINPPPPPSIRLSTDILDGLEELAQTTGFEVIGQVARLQRVRPQAQGEVQILPLEGDAREFSGILAPLDSQMYEQAVVAHQQGDRVRVVGTLQKRGRRWTLQDVSTFEPVPDGALDEV